MPAYYQTTPDDPARTILISGSLSFDDTALLLDSLPPVARIAVGSYPATVVGPTLTHLHSQPARRWTVADLAAAVIMSRSSFAMRFRTLVGLPPLDYLVRWRLQIAARALRGADRTVADIGSELGYTSGIDIFCTDSSSLAIATISRQACRARHNNAAAACAGTREEQAGLTAGIAAHLSLGKSGAGH